MNGKKRTYEPRIFEGRVMLPEDHEQIYLQLLTFKRMESVTDTMRDLILEEWPELAHKLPPKRPHGSCQAPSSSNAHRSGRTKRTRGIRA